jgi:FKBP-type peptidyl-prolyl cis-trans isomerase SlyD
LHGEAAQKKRTLLYKEDTIIHKNDIICQLLCLQLYQTGDLMNTTSKPNLVADDLVISLDYTLTVEGKLVDASEENEPIDFIQGYQNIIPGLEKELYNLSIGDSKEITISPKDGYGDIDPQAVMDVPRSEFPTNIALETGIELAFQQHDGQVVHAIVSSITDDSVRLDFNHPLAGKELVFRITVVDLRAATEEEISHGHVHGAHGEEEFDEDEFEEGEFEDDDFDEEDDEEFKDDDEK